MRRSARLSVLIAAIVVTGIIVWRASANEQRRAGVRDAAEVSDTMAAGTLDSLADLRASLYAYVAPGQGLEFWSDRAAGLLQGVRTSILDIDAAATIAGHPLAAQTIDDLDRLTSAELRARDAVANGQARFAGDIIFTDIRDRLDSVSAQVAGARRTMARVASSADVGITNEQSLLAGAAIAVWLFTAILLVPAPPVRAQHATRPVERRRPDALDLSLQAAAAGPEATEGTAADPVVPSAVVEPEAGGAAGLPALQSLASLCSDLGRVTDGAELDRLVSRGAELLGAAGLVVWVSDAEGTHLSPAAAHGYGAEALARIGTIPLSEENLTVSAFTRAAATKTAAGEARPAVAVPLLSSSGPVGVIAAEVSPGQDLDTVTALATVMAAQMATLFQPASSPASEPESEPAAGSTPEPAPESDSASDGASAGSSDSSGSARPDTPESAGTTGATQATPADAEVDAPEKGAIAARQSR